MACSSAPSDYNERIIRREAVTKATNGKPGGETVMGDAPLKPGDVRTFKMGKGNAVVLGIGVWARRRGKQLHIDITGTKTFHTTVTNDPGSKRYHRTLFRDLRRLLIENDSWRFGEEGSETERD